MGDVNTSVLIILQYYNLELLVLVGYGLDKYLQTKTGIQALELASRNKYHLAR